MASHRGEFRKNQPFTQIIKMPSESSTCFHHSVVRMAPTRDEDAQSQVEMKQGWVSRN